MTDLKAPETLDGFFKHEWQRDVPDAVTVAARDVSKKYGDAVSGVLFYGSCLRTGEIEDKILDFYIIVDSYRTAYDKKWMAAANKLIPPNVFYHEINHEGVTVRSKYAVLSLQDLEYRCSQKCLNVSVWARFCQPSLLLNAKNDHVADRIRAAIANAAKTMIAHILPVCWAKRASRELWVTAFEHTYASELRSEPEGKGLEIYELDKPRYDALIPLLLKELGAGQPEPTDKQPKRLPVIKNRTTWFFRRVNGKFVSLMRLIKASMTFDGGIDYLAWKIGRHSGVEIEVTDRMRKRPVLSGVVLFWNLRRKGAFK
jgi:predicted nucleotidyltransferase